MVKERINEITYMHTNTFKKNVLLQARIKQKLQACGVVESIK